MNALWALTRQTFSGAIRDWTVASIALYAVGFALLAPLVAQLALGAGPQAIADLGLAWMWAVGSVVAMVVGIRAVGGDLRDGTAILWLVRPFGRTTYVAGRYLGVLAVLALQVAGSLAAFTAISAVAGLEPSGGWLWFAVALWTELAVVAAGAMLLGTQMGGVPAGLATAGLWAVGHLADEYSRLAAAGEGGASTVVVSAVFLVIPDLDRFNLQQQVVHQHTLDATAVVFAVGYGGLWAMALTLLTSALLARRDLV